MFPTLEVTLTNRTENPNEEWPPWLPIADEPQQNGTLLERNIQLRSSEAQADEIPTDWDEQKFEDEDVWEPISDAVAEAHVPEIYIAL